MIANGGEITEEAEEAYHDLLTMRADKVAGYVAVIRRCEVSAEAVDDELARLTRNRDALKNTAQRLKDRLCFAMIGRGDKEHDTPLGKVRVQRASRRPLVLLVDPDDLPQRFRRVSVSADKTALAAALDEHDEEAVQPRGVRPGLHVPPHLLNRARAPSSSSSGVCARRGSFASGRTAASSSTHALPLPRFLPLLPPRLRRRRRALPRRPQPRGIGRAGEHLRRRPLPPAQRPHAHRERNLSMVRERRAARAAELQRRGLPVATIARRLDLSMRQTARYLAAAREGNR